MQVGQSKSLTLQEELPPLGFKNQQIIDFIHTDHIFPEANTFDVVLRLPIHRSYEEFCNHMCRSCSLLFLQFVYQILLRPKEKKSSCFFKAPAQINSCCCHGSYFRQRVLVWIYYIAISPLENSVLMLL